MAPWTAWDASCRRGLPLALPPPPGSPRTTLVADDADFEALFASSRFPRRSFTDEKVGRVWSLVVVDDGDLKTPEIYS